MVVRGKASRRHRKRKYLEDRTESYEKESRVSVTYSSEPSSKKLRPLLPIKDSSGILIQQYREEEDADNNNEETIELVDEKEVSEDQKYEEDLMQASVSQKKTEIAKICSGIVNDPQGHIHDLKKLQAMLWVKEPIEICLVVRKLSMASLTCVFTDIIPGYRIRVRTEEEKSVKLSKDVRSLVDFEESLLRHYQSFLDSLEKVLKNDQRQINRPLFTAEEHKGMVLLAVKSLCELYEKTTHFNFHNNIIMVLMPLANSRNKKISDIVCGSIGNVFRSDKCGQTSLATIKALARHIKDHSSSKKGVRPQLLDTFLYLHINHVDFEAIPSSQKSSVRDKKKAAEEKRKLSRAQRKYMKRQEKLQSELKATEATERKETKIKYHTEIIQQVFLVYFRILKQKKEKGKQKVLLNSVLEGLAQFAHLINVDFFSDLIVVLQDLVSSGELSFRQNLCCISTAFKVLSGQGEALNIDPACFYKHLYDALLQVGDFSKNPKQGSHEKSEDTARATDLKLVLDCLNIMLNKRRRQVTLSCLLAFIKRLCTVSLSIHPASAARSMLETAEKLIRSNSKTSTLFDVESQLTGAYLPELYDPEHCGAKSTCIWELQTLRRHYCPDVRDQANKMLKEFVKEQNR